MSATDIGFEGISGAIERGAGAWRSITSPLVFAADGRSTAPGYWNAVAAYYRTVESVCGGRQGGVHEFAVKSIDGCVCQCSRDAGDVTAFGGDAGAGGELGGGAQPGCCDTAFGGDEWRIGGSSVDNGIIGNGDVLSGDSGVVDEKSQGFAGKEMGKHYVRNRAKKEKRKMMRRPWRRGVFESGGGCVSDESVGSVATVDTRTGVEIEAAQTLAARRVVENKLAIARGKAQLLGFADKTKTEALQRLSAARMEQRINEAKAKSQASFKKCDESLKSLGSCGSAGEYAMKIEIRKAKQSEKLLEYTRLQAEFLAKHASPEVLRQLSDIPRPVYVDILEDFGDCSSDLSPEEAQQYYEDMNRLNEEEYARFCTEW